MLKAIYFALHFMMIFLGVVLAIHFDVWIGLAIAIRKIIICNATCSCMKFKNMITSCNLLHNQKLKKNVSRETFYLTKYLL